ncbi:MAG: STAS domain-containing protein [Gemmatimonadetes bacterium]|nr:STAS domain-containing protein [Gemmatimonadota bacterium]
MSIDVTWRQEAGVLVGAIQGRIDSSHAMDFLNLVDGKLTLNDTRLVLDFEGVGFISSAGLRACLIVARRFSASDRKFGICGLSQFNRDIMSVSGFDQLITVYETQAVAVGAVQDS